MLPNPGGQIDPADVVGRDSLIARLWTVLERQSVVLTAERRMGKTSILKKMCAMPKAETLAVYRDLEGVRTQIEFSEIVYRDVTDYLSSFTRTTDRVKEFLSQFGGIEIGGVLKFPETDKGSWKTLLTRTVEDLAANQRGRLVFFWDEVPLMLYNIARRDGEPAAMELLDTLRALRQMHDRFRMVYTGSVGLHNVVGALKRVGYANDPTNDMLTVEVPPLAALDAAALANDLLTGSGIRDAAPAAGRLIATEVDNVPYFIHHVVDRLQVEGLSASPEDVRDVVRRALVDSTDPWDLRHYRDRINTYYQPDEVATVLRVLDELACAADPLGFQEIAVAVGIAGTSQLAESLRLLLTALRRDHYIEQLPTGQYHFRFSILERYWRLDRGL